MAPQTKSLIVATVSNNAYFGRVDADWADVSGLAAQKAFDFSIGGKPEGIKPR